MTTGNRDHDGPRRRSDGEQTHAHILDAAMRLASIEGLGSLTIGRLARELGVSKSGVFAHFRSKQRLQEETLHAAEAVFQREVLQPGLNAPEGLARLESLCNAYLSYVERGVFPGGCFLAQALAEFDAQTGPLHDAVARGHQTWLELIEDQIIAAQRLKELDPLIDAGQLAFELCAPLELANYLATLYRDPEITARGRAAVRSIIARAKSGSQTTGA
ncbi:TetR/AcrR family transcriptional regulator [Aquisalimonas sp.]|uniref:TetR/AcrR family transcriptional regulator n=1 Tax=unclassified Aquisalimonas TaxID=2644645 RepID=UPI0025BBF1CA|nr:TetR/AcrR family transcriptional regulator [Aquisalimonas sp.]